MLDTYRENVLRYTSSVVTVVIIGIIWELVVYLHLVNPMFLPSPLSVLNSLVSLFSTEEIYSNIGATLYRVFAGLFLSCIVAIPLGLMLGRNKIIYRFVELPIDFFRSIPSSALFFLFILFFGIGNPAKIAVVFYGCSLVLLINTLYGSKPNRERTDRINMLRSFNANWIQILFYAVFRDALPNIIAGIRVCLSLAIVLVIVTEMFLGANDGLGKQLYDFYLTYRIPEMYALLIILGLTGFFANKAIAAVENQLLFWNPEVNR